METILMIQKAAAMGNWWLSALSWQHACLLMHHVLHRVFWQHIKSPRWLSPHAAQIWCSAFLAFPKTKITFEGEEISDHWWDSGNSLGQLMVIERTVCEVPSCLLWKGLRPTLSYAQGFLYLASSSINVSIFYITCITWLDSFWTNLVSHIYTYIQYYKCDTIYIMTP